MFNPMFKQGIRILTPADLELDLNSISSGTDLDDIDDDITFNMREGSENTYKIERELPQNNFNIRTLTQDNIEEMKRNSTIGWVPRL